MATVSFALLEKRSKMFLDVLHTVQTTKRLVDALAFKGQFPSRAGVVQPKIYRHLRRSEAIWNYLLLSGVPQTSTQVYEAVAVRGTCKSTASDELKATYSALSYGRDAGRLRRFGTKHWTIAR